MFHQNVSQVSIFSFSKIIICLFLTALGLRCWVQTFSSCGQWGQLFCGGQASRWGGSSCCGAQASGMLASIGAALGFSSLSVQAYLPLGMWNLPGPGIEPVFPALAGEFLFFKLKDNCFTVLSWFLSYINMNQPQVYLCPLPLEPPFHLPPHHTPLGSHRALDLSSLYGI